MVRLAFAFLIVTAIACQLPGPSGTPGTNGADGLNGANGRTTLARTRAEPPGVNCPAGGTALLVGLDANSDGRLDDTEVSTTTFLCSPVPTLVRTDTEPVGAHCALGGVVVLTGIDRNGDGTLQGSEVQDRRYVCGADASDLAIDGDVSIANSLDFERYQNVRRISGQLNLNSPRYQVTSLEFPRLEAVGALTVANLPTLERLSLPALTRLTLGTLSSLQSLPQLTVVELPMLNRVTGSLSITNTPRLTAVTMPQLGSVGGSLSLTNSTGSAMTAVQVDLPGLRFVGGSVSVRDNPLLVDCSLLSLRSTLAASGSPTASIAVANNGWLLPSLDGGWDAGCDPRSRCWFATPAASFPRLFDGGSVAPDWAADGGLPPTTLVFCDSNAPLLEAPQRCEAMGDGGRLPNLETPFKNDILVSRATQYWGTSLNWSLPGGARDLEPDGGLTNPDGGWWWSSGVPMRYDNWYAGEPQGGPLYNCLAISPDGWDDVACSTSLPLTCELPAP